MQSSHQSKLADPLIQKLLPNPLKEEPLAMMQNVFGPQVLEF